MFNEELFGAVSEEKDVAGITVQIPEARKCKSRESYGLLAKYVSHTSLGTLVSPIIQVSLSTNVFIFIIEDCLLHYMAR